MTRHYFLALMLGMAGTQCAMADYADVPFKTSNGEFNYDGFTFSTKDGYYQEWDHYVLFWSTGYGNHTNPTTIGSGNYLLNLAEMKDYAEKCYDTYTALGFADPTKLGNKSHKIIILAYYSTDWFATGSGYGDYGLLNISHASANPNADYYTYCHEIAHAYQYLGYNLNGGNAGFQYGNMYGYVSYYECSANWQASQIYTEKHFPQITPVYQKTTNLAFGNQWHCYQAYPMNDYFTEKRSNDVIGKIWTVNTNTKYADPVEKYMSLYNLSAEEVYREFFWGAMRMATWDLDCWSNHLAVEHKSCTNYMDHTPGTKAAKNTATTSPSTYNDNCWQHASTYQYVTIDKEAALHQVAYSSAPQSTGYNVIQLNVPNGGNRTVTTTFTALESGCSLANGDNKEYWCGSMWATNPSIGNYNSSQTKECNSTYDTYKNWRGFRLGYVTYNKSTGERTYNYTDKVYCTGTGESEISIQFDVPEGADYLYLIVSPALSNYLRMGAQDPYNINNDADYLAAQKERDQWPYRVQFFNTNIYGLSNPANSFNGEADKGTTYTSAQLPDMGSGNGENVEEPTPLEHSCMSLEVEKSISFNTSANEYVGGSVALTERELEVIADCFGISASEIKNPANWELWKTSGPGEHKVTLYGVDADGITLKDTCSTAQGYGHWYNNDNNVCAYGSGKCSVFSEYDVENATFTIGQMPSFFEESSKQRITQAIVFTDQGQQYIAYIHFNITITISDATKSELTRGDVVQMKAVYTPHGIKTKELQQGINLIKRTDGSVKKVYVR